MVKEIQGFLVLLELLYFQEMVGYPNVLEGVTVLQLEVFEITAENFRRR